MKLFPVFSPKSFIVLPVTFRFLTHFSLNRLCEVRKGTYISFPCGYLVSSAQFSDKTVHFPFNDLGVLDANYLATPVRLFFGGLYPIPWFYPSIFMEVSYCFDYYNFVVSFKIRTCESSSFSLFQNCIGYLGPSIPCEY